MTNVNENKETSKINNNITNEQCKNIHEWNKKNKRKWMKERKTMTELTKLLTIIKENY